MKNFFGYIYYRVNKVYFKWDGRRGFTSLLAVSMIQIMWPFILFALVSKFIWLPGELSSYKQEIKIFVLAIFAIIIFVNYLVYDQTFHLYRRKFSAEDQKKAVTRGVGIVLLLVLPWILLPIIINSRF